MSELRVLGRATEGVKLIDLRGKDFIASITKVPTENDEEQAQELEGAENATPESNNPEATDTNTEKE